MRLSHVGQNGRSLGNVQAGIQRAVCIMIAGAMRTTPTNVLEMFLDLSSLGTTMKSVALMATYCLLGPNPKTPEIRHHRVWAKTDNHKFSMIKDHVTLRRTFGKYRIVILTREKWEKNWPK